MLLIAFPALAICYARSSIVMREEKSLSEIVTSFTGQNASFQAQIASEISLKHTYNTIQIKLLEPLEVNGVILSQKGNEILVKIKKYQEIKIGDICTFRGTFKIPENFDDFAYQDYLKNNNIYLTMEFPNITCNGARGGFWLQNKLVDFKNNLNKIIADNLKEPQSSLLMGIIFGQDRLFSESFDNNIRIAGVSHIVAASGYNITILLIAGNQLFKLFPHKIKITFLLLLIWLFCILSGLSPSIVRACIMTTISLLALFLGKKNSIHISLPLASCIFVIIDPKILFNVGFQLSVVSTAGLIYLQPTLTHISEILFRKKIPFLSDVLFPTLSCTIATLPVTIATFNTISIWSIVANCLILPVIETTMFFGILGICFSNILVFLSKFFFEIANVQLKYFELVVNTIRSLNFGYWELSSVSIIAPIAIVVITILLCIYYYPVENEDHNYYLKIFD
jgi:competence protein ComEC